LFRFDVGILEQSFRPGIHRDNGIKNTCLRIGIELDQDPAFGHIGTFAIGFMGMVVGN
jgi:hypothetical protein